ncbi:DEAD/DEAH box helicase family protein [Geomesophilobacter sediminis]|uniref:DEAD/DEAH box helicase family protein n=1 Tax=Geomesophilobacter sediminis TaxID=2798584 RepID=A0A8J7ISR4_9BACT|nr:DEAD/DEAH box helicase family protein [Geomesophilobacter sediminis]MBJ6726394.1 DEAD/DEAH box helicase family protein [Geomesophilobacter sediminis]
MEFTEKINNHSRTKGNELAKGFYPTFPRDVELVRKVVSISFGWDRTSVHEKMVTIFDPCAGEGAFLSSMVRHAKQAATGSSAKNTAVASFAVELDAERFRKIRGTDQKLNTSFFDTTNTGSFDIVLLNPPYNRNGGELISWVEKAAPMVSKRGVMVLIIPEYELKGKMTELLRGSFTYRYAYRSEEYGAFRQLVIFLRKNVSNETTSYRSPYYHNYDNLDNAGEDLILTHAENPTVTIEVEAGGVKTKPMLQCRDLSGFYLECEERLDKAITVMLDKEYPASYDTSIQPVSTLRTAHAVQLAAMNSQIESVAINGVHYLAKYMLVEKPETFEDYDDNGIKTTTVIHKPTVETFLMDRTGEVKAARELGFDYVELNSQLSTILLKKLTTIYKPLHEIGRDEEYLASELKEIGLKAPQREAVKAVMKAFASGRKGIGIRANTGTGKTWMSKAVKYLAGAKRSIMVTEPQLVPQMVKEYEYEGFAVHVIDSWQRLRELARTKPKGLYLIAYTRLRMHPDFVPVTKTTRVKTKEGIKYTDACLNCSAEVKRISRGSKEHCPACGDVLYTYIPENKRPRLRYRQWIADIERNGASTEVKSHNKQLPYLRFLKRIPFDLAIFDEAHNAANLMSNQGTAFIRMAASARRVLCLTATVTNGMAKSLYNLLWGVNPVQMREAGWDMKSATDFQARFGAYKEVRKSDERNRHRDSEKVQTYDTAGISPAALVYTLPNFVNVDSEDFDDLPPVEREVIKCAPHTEVEDCMRTIDKIIDNAELPIEDRIPVASVRTAAFLRVSDTFRHADDEIRLRGELLGTLWRRPVDELLEKETELVNIARLVETWGERLLVYTGNTQKIDMRGPLRRIIADSVPGLSIDVLPDSVAPERLTAWFEKTTAQVVIASYHRVATGLNLSQFNNLCWYDYSDNTRLAEQGEGRIRRVNTADIHRMIYGEVRPCRYWYLTSSPIQEAQLAYTLEKRMIAKLAEGETPDIDPAECTSGNQSFSALITKALKEGNIDYQDPSALLKKMTRTDNARVRDENKITTSPPAAAKVIPFPQPEPPTPPAPETVPVIVFEGGWEVERQIPAEKYREYLEEGMLEVTLFGTYLVTGKCARRGRA